MIERHEEEAKALDAQRRLSREQSKPYTRQFVKRDTWSGWQGHPSAVRYARNSDSNGCWIVYPFEEYKQ